MKRDLINTLKEIKNDLLRLKIRGDLTEFGKGELHLILIIEEYLTF